MEPERPIEKELRAYAEKRRAAGAPAEMPAAKRKLLLEQAELLSKGRGEEALPWWQTLWNSWPRLMVAGGAVAALALIIGFLLPPRNARQEYFRSSKELARNDAADFKKQPLDAEKTAPNAAATRALRSEAPMTINSPKGATQLTSPTVDKINGQAPILAGVPASTPAPVAAPAPPPAAAFGGAASGVAAQKNMASNTEDVSLSFDNSRKAPATAHENRAPLALSPKLDGDFSKDATTTAAVQPFLRTDLWATDGKVGAVTGASSVLTSFRVEQAMGKLRIIDDDGSIYTGFVEQKPEAAKQTPAAKKLEAKDKADLATASAGQIQPVRRYRFRVSGTNRTLKENVVFTGDFLTSAGLLTPPLGANSASEGIAPGASSKFIPFELRKARLEGRLLFGKTNKIEIRAAPANP